MPRTNESVLLSAENIQEIANYYRFDSDNHAFNIMALIAHIDGLEAERNALRGVLEQIAAEEPGRPGVPALYAHQARYLAMAALERPE